jgi:hypothetical protein
MASGKLKKTEGLELIGTHQFLFYLHDVRFEVLTAVRMTLLFWVLTPCRFIGRYQCSGET